MKQCNKCGSLLPLDAFHLRSSVTGARRGECRSCKKQYHREYYQRHKERYRQHQRRNQPKRRERNRRQLFDYLSDKACVDCGETDRVVLELDHVRGDKEFNIGSMVSMFSWTRIAKELEKCEIRCANCHRRKTARDYKWFKGVFGA
jgi:hypothetical protein